MLFLGREIRGIFATAAPLSPVWFFQSEFFFFTFLNNKIFLNGLAREKGREMIGGLGPPS
jgi:hypothetical protein